MGSGGTRMLWPPGKLAAWSQWAPGKFGSDMTVLLSLQQMHHADIIDVGKVITGKQGCLPVTRGGYRTAMPCTRESPISDRACRNL